MVKNLIQLIKDLRNFLQKHSSKYADQLPYLIIGFISVLIFVGGISLFINLTDSVRDNTVSEYDESISDAIVAYRSPFLTDYFTFVTEVGDAIGYVVVFILCTLIFYLVFKNWKYVVQIATVMILALSSNLILKQIINRARPTAEHLVEVKTLSYPSGHAMMSMAFYGFLIYLIHHFKFSKGLTWLLTILMGVLILSIGVSRIYLGVHYPSDIAGGFIAGLVWVVFCAMMFQLIRIFKRDPAT
ncbi:MAG: phosphatase PAP2 family protein [Nonlabens sp.]